jgi:hypothetical protein
MAELVRGVPIFVLELGAQAETISDELMRILEAAG